MFNFKWLFPKEIQAYTEKDPNDFTKSISSTDWEPDYYCDHCKNSLTLKQTLGRICPTCGKCVRFSFEFKHRSKRWIVFKQDWVMQFRYDNNKTELRNKNMEIINE